MSSSARISCSVSRIISSQVQSSYLELSTFGHLSNLRFISHAFRSHRHRLKRHFHANYAHREDVEIRTTKDILKSYKESFSVPAPSHEIRQLTGDSTPSNSFGYFRIHKANPPLVGSMVTIDGYLGERKDLSRNLSFVTVKSRDLKYKIQIVSSAFPGQDTKSLAHDRLKAVPANSPVVISGILKVRKSKRESSWKEGDCEIELREIYCLNEFPKDIILKKDTHFPPQQRHLQLRVDNSLRQDLAFRSEAGNRCRNELHIQEFTEVETPLLFKSTPEGAREFLVPTRHRGLAYALPQSPQQYKQILMASGIPKYFQFAKCFRDEDTRTDRQPEFTQLDLEMSFATGEDVMRSIRRLIRVLWKDMLQWPCNFLHLTYQDAMQTYGSDKPDPRLKMPILDVTSLVHPDSAKRVTSLPDPVIEVIRMRIVRLPQVTEEFLSAFMDSPMAEPFINNPNGPPQFFVVPTSTSLRGFGPFTDDAADHLHELLRPLDGDLIILQARKNEPFSGASTALGRLRVALHRFGVAQAIVGAPKGFEFVWVTDFPLFSAATSTEPGQGGTAGLRSTHHPFTAPKSVEDVDLLLTDPTKAKADHYDLVVNGVELGGGSRRIHDAHVQEFILRDVLKMPPERLAEFSHLLEVLRAGCPPHAGLALGFDRMIAVMLGHESIRKVIAFPKNGEGEDELVNSPSVMSEESLKTYHLKVIE